MTSDPHPTRALEAAARRRRELREALIFFEDALAAPILDRVTWRAEVVGALAALGHAFEVHIAETEASGGLYEEMSDIASHLSAKANRLREEHPAITASLVEASARLVETPADEADADDAREMLQQLMDRIVRHRQRGADLVWEAYAIDIGNAG